MIDNISAEPMDFLPNRVSDKWYDFLIIRFMIDSHNMIWYDHIYDYIMILSYSHQTARNIWPCAAHWHNLNQDYNSDYTVKDLIAS